MTSRLFFRHLKKNNIYNSTFSFLPEIPVHQLLNKEWLVMYIHFLLVYLNYIANCSLLIEYQSVWSSGMIPASGAGGPGFDSRNRPKISFSFARTVNNFQQLLIVHTCLLFSCSFHVTTTLMKSGCCEISLPFILRRSWCTVFCFSSCGGAWPFSSLVVL